MATFNFDEVKYGQRLDWLLLRDGAIHYTEDALALEKICLGLKQYQYQEYRFDASKWQTVEMFHREIAHSLSFPDYYGENLDALNDCVIGDLEIPLQGGVFLVFLHYDLFLKRFPYVGEQVLDILASGAWNHALFGKMLLTLFTVTDVASLPALNDLGGQRALPVHTPLHFWKP